MKMYGLTAVVVVTLLLGCHIGQALECYSCDFGTCLLPSKKTCGLTEVCNTQTAKAGYLNLKKRSCISPLQCVSESTVTYLGVDVKTTNNCCITNLCNSSAAPKVSVITGIAAVLALLFTKFF
ncbi:uncharacterized protein PAF06_002590 [Gastrophryne carolinensis]